ncbi:MAG TPA: uroporphyrinogen-III synthase [Lentimicrobium sp.]|nr:uroporphyrinogen-III synthase [Lentimicrobium sp.]
MKVKNILVSQPKPVELEKSPYYEIIKKHNVSIDFHKFFKIDGYSSIDFRKENKVRLNDFTAIIFTSKNGVDHYFRLAGELRIDTPDSMKYFCTTDSIAFYLQKYIQFRKRRIFYAQNNANDLIELIKKHKTEKFLLPCNEDHNNELSDILDANKISHSKAVMYRTVSEDMSFLDLNKYDMMVFFSPSGIKSLFKNFPEFVQGEKAIAVSGGSTAQAAREAGLNITFEGPNAVAPSMVKAIDLFLTTNNKAK